MSVSDQLHSGAGPHRLRLAIGTSELAGQVRLGYFIGG